MLVVDRSGFVRSRFFLSFQFYASCLICFFLHINSRNLLVANLGLFMFVFVCLGCFPCHRIFCMPVEGTPSESRSMLGSSRAQLAAGETCWCTRPTPHAAFSASSSTCTACIFRSQFQSCLRNSLLLGEAFHLHLHRPYLLVFFFLLRLYALTYVLLLLISPVLPIF